MRHTNYILSTIATLTLLAGCSKPGTPGTSSVLPVASGQPIEFNAGTPGAAASNAPQTKGAPQLSTLERLAAQDFSVSAWYTPDGESYSASSESYIDNHRFGTLDPGPSYTTWRGITRTGGKAADPVYYPLDGTLTFFCYAPYRADISNTSDVCVDYAPDPAVTSQLADYLPGSPLITFTPSATTFNQIDFLMATPLLDVDRTGGAIPLDFTRHLTTNIQFWCKYNGTLDASEGVMISKIAITDVIGSEYLYFTEASDGTLGYSRNSTISPVDGSSVMPLASYEMTSASECLIFDNPFLDDTTPKHINNTINGNVYLLPQTLPATAQLEITYVVKHRVGDAILDENILVFPLAGTPDWPMGKTVKYTIDVDVAARKDLTVTVSIEDWNNSGNTHPEQELMY